MSNEITAVGSNGSVTVTEDGVLIRRKADVLTFLNQGLQGDKTIPWRSITAVQFKAAGKHLTGYIQFSAHGHVEPKRGLFPHVNDENCVLFLANQQWAFDRAKTEIDARIRALSAPPPAAATPAPAFSAASELEKLATLLDKGLLTREEFDERKKVILSISPTAPAPSRPTAVSPASLPVAQLPPRPTFSHPEPLRRPDYEPPAMTKGKGGTKGMLVFGVIGLVVILLIALGQSNGGGSSQPSSASSTSYRSPPTPSYVPPPPTTTPTPPQSVSPLQGMAGQRTMTTVQGANLRSSAGMDGGVVRQIPVNAQVSVLETSGNWVRASYEGSVGWIHRSLVRE